MSLKTRLALYQPDIPQNTGTLMRLCGAFDVPLEIIEPTGFIWSHKGLGRAVMDYKDAVDATRHKSWDAFKEWRASQEDKPRLILLTTKGNTPYYDFEFQTGDIIMGGRESAGVPDDVHDYCDARVIIPQATGRSLNLATACAIVLSEALRQTNGFHDE